jgi:Uma2 family endonuclease
MQQIHHAILETNKVLLRIIMSDQSPARTMTATEFLDLPESSTPMELIDGELIMAPAPLLSHQKIIGRLYLLLVTLQGIDPDNILLAPTDVYFDDGNVFQPDVVWLSSTNQNCMEIGDRHLRGAPDLVVEVLSPGTAQQDMGKKRQVYEQHGVREYWLVDGAARTVEVLVLRDDTFVELGVFTEANSFKSSVLGDAVIDVSKIFPS